MHLSLILALVSQTSLASVASEVEEARPNSLVLSPAGPHDGQDAVSLGVTFFGPIPALDLRYVRAVGERSAIEGVLSSAGIVQRLRAGARYRITPDSARSAFAIRASLMESHSLGDDYHLAAGVGPGLAYSFGQNDTHWSLALDLAWSFLDRGNFNDVKTAIQVCPAAGVELPLARDVHLLIEASTLLTMAPSDTFVTPLLSGALVW